MFSTGRLRRAFCVALTCGSTAVVAAQTQSDATLYRVFLRDGSTLVSYGEYARVADRLVVSLPLGDGASVPDLQLLSIPADSVDWDKTDAYADSARAARYAATRGPDDFALLNQAVSRALTDVALTTDTARKIAMAGEARQNVMRWAAEHYGYRAQDVASLAGLFDRVIAETRAASGQPNFDLSLVANMAAPPAVPLLPAPTLHDNVEQALRAVTLAPDATERTSLLHAIERTLGTAGADAAWTAPLRARVTAALAIEDRADRVYAALTRESLREADRYAGRGDVTGVERVVRGLLRQDDRLGQRRPQEMAALLATLDARLDAARRLRLARDNRAARAEALRRYRHVVSGPLEIMRRSRTSLDQIRRLAGPSRARVARLATEMSAAARRMTSVDVPVEASAANDLLKNAVQLALRAAQARQRAIATGKMQLAWEASSAAAGAIMLLDRAADELRQLRMPTVE